MYQYLNQKIFNSLINRKFFLKKNKKKIFSVRKFAGATVNRAYTFYTKEPETVDWIDKFNNGSNFIDIGANIGIYSLYAASKKNNVISLEPESLNFFLLNLNIKDNEFEKYIKAYPICAGEKIEINSLNLSSFKFGGSGHSFGNTIGSDMKEFNSIYAQGSISCDLDTLTSTLKFKPNYIKIDVDGNEHFVIKGMKNLLNDKDLFSILVEINNNNINHLEILDIIKNHGFKQVLKAGQEDDPTNNFIFNR